MAQLSAEEVAAVMGLAPDHPEVLEALEAQRRQSRVERTLGGYNPPGRREAPRAGGRALRAATRNSRGAPPLPTPKPKRSGEAAGCPGTAEQDDHRASDALDRTAAARDAEQVAAVVVEVGGATGMLLRAAMIEQST